MNANAIAKRAQDQNIMIAYLVNQDSYKMAFVCKIAEIIIILKQLLKNVCLVALVVEYALALATLSAFNVLQDFILIITFVLKPVVIQHNIQITIHNRVNLAMHLA